MIGRDLAADRYDSRVSSLVERSTLSRAPSAGGTGRSLLDRGNGFVGGSGIRGSVPGGGIRRNGGGPVGTDPYPDSIYREDRRHDRDWDDDWDDDRRRRNHDRYDCDRDWYDRHHHHHHHHHGWWGPAYYGWAPYAWSGTGLSFGWGSRSGFHVGLSYNAWAPTYVSTYHYGPYFPAYATTTYTTTTSSWYPGYSSYSSTTYSYPGYSSATYVSSYAPAYDTYVYETVEPWSFSCTEYVSRRRAYAWTRDVVVEDVYYGAPATTVTYVYDRPRSYVRHRPSRFYFFVDLGDYESRRVPSYVHEVQTRYEEPPTDVRESSDPLGAGYALFANGSYYHALVEFDRAVAAAPDDGLVLFARAQAYFAVRDYRSAHDDIARGMELIPDWGRVEINMKEFYSDPASLDEQIASLERWTATHPDDYRGRFVLGYVRYFLQDYVGARSELVRVLALKEDHAQARRLLENVYEREAAAELAAR